MKCIVHFLFYFKLYYYIWPVYEPAGLALCPDPLWPLGRLLTTRVCLITFVSPGANGRFRIFRFWVRDLGGVLAAAWWAEAVYGIPFRRLMSLRAGRRS